MDQSKMEDFIANAALLAAHLTQQCEKSVADQQASAQDIQRSAGELSAAMAAGQQALARQAKAAIREALAGEIPAAVRSLGETTDRLKATAEQLRSEQASASHRMRVLGWKALASFGFASVSAVASTGYVAWHNVKRAERAQVDAQVLEALRQVAITSCSGTPCVKLEDGLRRWAKNDEYVLIDTTAGPETSSR